MSSTLLEQTRAAHEEVERLERLVVKDLQQEAKSHRERLYQGHRVRRMVQDIVSASQRLVDIYEDADGVRKDEIASLGGQNAAGQNVYGSFYDRLKEIREYHKKHPGARAVDAGENDEDLIKEEPYVEFSGEEGLGRFLDLHELYQRFTGSKFGQIVFKDGEVMEYATYLRTFAQTHEIARNYKFSKQYKDYITALFDYLQLFFERTQPLQDLPSIFRKVESDFEERWQEGKVQGWEDKGDGQVASTMQNVIDLDVYDTVEAILELGPEKLKEALSSVGLKTGGTPQQRAERLLSLKDTPLDELDRKHFAKGVVPPKKSTAEAAEQQRIAAKDIALLEVKLQRLCELLREPIEETRSHVEKKQALTYDEMEAEREEEEIEAESDSDDEDAQIYNPLKLPMGWDGKPIPYWLYKLHGLGQEFKCEICGNYSYWGRRAFERHFKEWRHQHGMRCLGIPNTKNFHEITVIKDAEELWERIREKQGTTKWRPEVEEECEDAEGNVYNKKTYTDLKRQGLV
eukprot:SM000044S16002  [mRNA]  locus=s44:547480:551288:+ [translate_table: standard]